MVMMMLGMLFQQASQAWRTGTRRADMYEQIRGYFGAIQRDASCAVDEKTVPRQVRQLLGGGGQSFSGQLRFYTLSGSGFNAQDSSASDPRRSLTYVEYSGLNRREKTLCISGPEPVLSTVIAKDVSVGSIQAFSWNGNSAGVDFPAFVTVQASVNPRAGQTLEIGAGSAGLDGQWNTSDDIATWVE